MAGTTSVWNQSSKEAVWPPRAAASPSPNVAKNFDPQLRSNFSARLAAALYFGQKELPRPKTATGGREAGASMLQRLLSASHSKRSMASSVGSPSPHVEVMSRIAAALARAPDRLCRPAETPTTRTGAFSAAVKVAAALCASCSEFPVCEPYQICTCAVAGTVTVLVSSAAALPGWISRLTNSTAAASNCFLKAGTSLPHVMEQVRKRPQDTERCRIAAGTSCAKRPPLRSMTARRSPGCILTL
mmetsp:Transcript_21392/g.49785  ORF Transcript_21392/g.49785 Transcript_21392/m.49785 type:complete len:244 (-) Transcript_21392:39-770(-)